MTELRTEPAFQLPRASKRPWWAAALVGGLSAGAGLAGSLWLASGQARGSEPTVRTAGVAAQAQTEAEWRHEVVQSLQDLRERMARIEGRLERK